MLRPHVRQALTMLLLIGAVACPQYARQGPLVERLSPEVSASRLRVLGTIAGGGTRSELRISATVRQQLTDSGLTVIKTPGRWASPLAAVQAVCAPTATPAVHGVLFIWYNRLELYDCDTQRPAYEVSGGSKGIQGMADRLVAYLRRDTQKSSTD